jgi:hypothetical protein
LAELLLKFVKKLKISCAKQGRSTFKSLKSVL